MSGTLPQYRPANRPLYIDGTPVYKFDKYGQPVMRSVVRPGGVWKNGRCVEWLVSSELVVRHVLSYIEPAERPSKHARGRIRPRTRAEQRRAERLVARATQVRKSLTIDLQHIAAMNLVDPATS